MNPVLVIPTFVGTRRKTPNYNVVATYDHVTPFTHQGELPRCLASLRDNGIRLPIILLVVSESGVEHEASVKIKAVAEAFLEVLDILVIDSNLLSGFYQRAEQLGLPNVKEGISLTGYGAMRNMGLVVAATLGFTEVVFLDDDEVVVSPEFAEQALYGLGKLSKKGIPVLVKSGFFIDRQGRWKSKEQRAWYDRYWEQGKLFNKWITKVMDGPRLARSNVLNGGVMSMHREAFRRVAFDPWIPRGEDLDYLLNVRMYGGSVWFDNQWSVQHLPPTERNEAQRFKQDIYRWIYEHRKLEFSKTQIDLLQIQPHSLDPYPGPFLENSVTTRVLMTALLRTLGRKKDRHGYLKAAQVSRREAKAYAEMFCSKYFEFQLGWAQSLSIIEGDGQMQALFASASVRSAYLDGYGEGGQQGYAPVPLQAGQPVQLDASGAGFAAGMAGGAGGFAGGAAGMAGSLGMATDAPISAAPLPYGAVGADGAAAGVGGAAGTARAPGMSGTSPDLFDFELDLAALGIDIDDEDGQG